MLAHDQKNLDEQYEQIRRHLLNPLETRNEGGRVRLLEITNGHLSNVFFRVTAEGKGKKEEKEKRMSVTEEAYEHSSVRREGMHTRTSPKQGVQKLSSTREFITLSIHGGTDYRGERGFDIPDLYTFISEIFGSSSRLIDSHFPQIFLSAQKLCSLPIFH